MSKELIVLGREIDWEKDTYKVLGFEVENGNYKDSSRFEIIFYRDQGYSSYSSRAWYELVDEIAEQEQQTNFFKQW